MSPSRTFDLGLEPVVARFADGREFTFPPDIEADKLLAWSRKYGEYRNPADMPQAAMEDFLRLVMGDELEAVASQMGTRELLAVSRWLAETYLAGEEPSANGPPA